MDFTNVKDPAGINALLESLRSSQVFSLSGTSTSTTPSAAPTETVVSPTEETTTTPTQVTQPTTQTDQQQTTVSLGSTESSSSSLSTHLSSLLSRLQPLIHRSPATPSTESLPSPPHQSPFPRNSATTSLRELSFKKSLSILAQLLEDPLVISRIIQMRQDQENMEMSLWNGRQRLVEQQQERVKDVLEKARIINIPPTGREIEQLENEFERELMKYDRERVLVAWDSLIEKQQTTLENLGFPTMYVTKDPEERARQQKIIDVIVNAC